VTVYNLHSAEGSMRGRPTSMLNVSRGHPVVFFFISIKYNKRQTQLKCTVFIINTLLFTGRLVSVVRRFSGPLQNVIKVSN
jgi:hypothetical protein